MTQHAITLPYLRTSPNHIPRRDLVLSASDSLSLVVTVVETDHPNAQALILDIGINGPAMQLVIWQDHDIPNGWCDYQRPGTLYGTVLQSVSGYPSGAAGSWEFHLPTGSFANGTWRDFPIRCGWSILLLWNNGAKSSVLSQGIMNIMRPRVWGVPLIAVPPDPTIPVVPPVAPSLLWLTTDSLIPIVASDTLKQLETS
jgi:hypothetical protein